MRGTRSWRGRCWVSYLVFNAVVRNASCDVWTRRFGPAGLRQIGPLQRDSSPVIVWTCARRPTHRRAVNGWQRVEFRQVSVGHQASARERCWHDANAGADERRRVLRRCSPEKKRASLLLGSRPLSERPWPRGCASGDPVVIIVIQSCAFGSGLIDQQGDLSTAQRPAGARDMPLMKGRRCADHDGAGDVGACSFPVQRSRMELSGDR